MMMPYMVGPAYHPGLFNAKKVLQDECLTN